jgi:thiamine biosynthesis lipoprotein
MSILPTIKGLGTSWWIEVFDELSAENAQIIFDDLSVFISNFDNNYSRFKPESIVSNLNSTRKLLKPTQETIDILNYGLMLYHDTNQVFNFLIGETMEAHGYDAKYSFTPQDSSVTTPDPAEALRISPERIVLSLGHIDIGGYGKGYLIDLIAQRLKDLCQLQYFLINGGGDMFGTSDFGKPITVYLEHPTKGDTYIEQTTLLNEGFAASSTQKRRWESAGKVYTHIVDTKTGESSLNSLGIFVKAPTAALADAWATTLLISAPKNHTKVMKAKLIRAAAYDETQNTLSYFGKFH